MKSVIIVCLLSLSVSFVVGVPAAPTEGKSEPPKADAVTTPSTVAPTVPSANTTAASPTTEAPAKTTVDPKASTTEAATTTKDKPDPNNKVTTPVPPKDNTTTTVTPEQKTNVTTPVPDSKDGGKTVTTPKSEVVVPTEAPKVHVSRAFDGWSFIGGMILTLGLLAIGFMGFKYYKNQTERNYHTL